MAKQLQIGDQVSITGKDLTTKWLSDSRKDCILLESLCKGIDENKNISKESFQKHRENEVKYRPDIIERVSKNVRLIRPFVDIVSENHFPKNEIKVLEINYSNDLLAERVDTYLSNYNFFVTKVDYTIAVPSIDGIPEEYNNIKTIEWKANDRSVFPSQEMEVDLIVYKDSQELWHLNLDKHIRKASDTLVDSGFLLALFRDQLTEPEIISNNITGNEINKTFLEERIEKYLKTAKTKGLRVIGRKTDSIGWTALLLRKTKSTIPSSDNIVFLSDNISDWFSKIKNQINYLNEENMEENVWLIANESTQSGILGLTNCLRQEPGGHNIRCIFDFDQSIKAPIDITKQPFSEILNNDLALNVIKEGQLGTYRHIPLPKDWSRTESNEYYLNKYNVEEKCKAQWFDLGSYVPNEFEYSAQANSIILCEVYMSCLNANDVRILTGDQSNFIIQFHIHILFVNR